MGKIYTNQTSLKIRLTTGVDIDGALTKEIRYIKPDGTTGAKDAEPEDVATGIIFYNFVKADSELLDQVGRWKFYAYIEFSDQRVAVGEDLIVQIYEK